MKQRRMDMTKWNRVEAGYYRTVCGRGKVERVTPNSWRAIAWGDRIGSGTTAAQAAWLVETKIKRVLEQASKREP